MRQTIKVFTSSIFIYSFLVCIACKRVSSEKVGNLELSRFTMEELYYQNQPEKSPKIKSLELDGLSEREAALTIN